MRLRPLTGTRDDVLDLVPRTGQKLRVLVEARDRPGRAFVTMDATRVRWNTEAERAWVAKGHGLMTVHRAVGLRLPLERTLPMEAGVENRMPLNENVLILEVEP